MKTKQLTISLVATLLFTFLASNGFANVQLDTICIDSTNKAVRSYERTLCDEKAEKAGYKHGVFKPLQPGCSPDLTSPNPCLYMCLDGTEAYECLGAGQVITKSESIYCTVDVVDKNRVYLTCKEADKLKLGAKIIMIYDNVATSCTVDTVAFEKVTETCEKVDVVKPGWDVLIML